MYFVKYGENYIHDPRIGLVLSEANLDTELNKSDILTFTITKNHKFYDVLKERDKENPVSVLWDDEIMFRGEITTIESDFYLTKTITCRGELSYLNDSIVRPYSTLEGETSRTAPSTVDGYFEFLINEHNSQVEESKRFKIGRNEGVLLDPNNYIYRSDITYPYVGETIKDKIINSIGGYLKLDYNKDGTRTISLLKEVEEVNSQLIDFGVNLLDFVKNDETASTISFIIPLGATINDENEDTIDEYLTITDEPDGEIERGYVKYGDMIYSLNTVSKFGFIGKTERFDDITVASNLVRAGLAALKEYDNPITTIEIKAIDLSIIKPDYKQIQVGQYIHARSKPHNFDSYMLCSKISYDLIQPDNNVFTLGHVYDTFTGRSNTAIDTLNKSLADSTGENYKLPTATDEILGGVKVGEGLTIDENGRLNGASPYVLPISSNDILGGVKVGYGLAIDDDGTLNVTVEGGSSYVAEREVSASLYYARTASYEVSASLYYAGTALYEGEAELPSNPDSIHTLSFCMDTGKINEDFIYTETMGYNPVGLEELVAFTRKEITPAGNKIFTRSSRRYTQSSKKDVEWNRIEGHAYYYDIEYNEEGEVIRFKKGWKYEYSLGNNNDEILGPLDGSYNEAIDWYIELDSDGRYEFRGYVKPGIIAAFYELDGYYYRCYYEGQLMLEFRAIAAIPEVNIVYWRV